MTHRRRRRTQQPRLFPELVEPIEPPEVGGAAGPSGDRPPPRSCGARDLLRRPTPRVERVDLDAPRPRLTAEPLAWLDSIDSGETRRAYRRDVLDLMRRLGLDTEPKLVCLEREDAVRYRDLLQALVDASELAPGTARRRMAACLSLYDHLQRRYLVPHNPFFKLRRPRARAGEGDGQAVGGSGTCGPRRRRACRRTGCPLAVLHDAADSGAAEPRIRRRPCDAGLMSFQLRLW